MWRQITGLFNKTVEKDGQTVILLVGQLLDGKPIIVARNRKRKAQGDPDYLLWIESKENEDIPLSMAPDTPGISQDDKGK